MTNCISFNKVKIGLPSKIVIRLIWLYQKTLSPDHGGLSLFYSLGGGCRFRPTCSEYALGAIVKYGLLKGTIKSIFRIVRCNPWSKGGWDPP